MKNPYVVGIKVKIVDDFPDLGGIVGVIESRDDEGYYDIVMDCGHRLYGFRQDELEEV